MAQAPYGHCEFGVDYATPPHELPDSALADSLNCVPTRKGLLTGRKGHLRFNSTSLGSRTTSVHEFRSGTTRSKIATYGTKIGVFSEATGDFVDQITGLTDNKMFQWVNFGKKAICVNEGANVPQYWDGSAGGDLGGSPPTGKTIIQWANRLWFGGNATEGATLSGSVLNDPTLYTGSGTATGAVSQPVGDAGDPITGMYGYFDYLLVGKQNTIYKVAGAPPTDATKLSISPLYSRANESDNVGFTSPWAITQVGNDVIFLDGFDIKSLTGIQEFGDVKHNSIIPHFRDYLESICDKDLLQYSKFFHYKREEQIWVSMPMTSSTHYVFVLDYKFKDKTGRFSVFPIGGVIASCFGGFENGTNDDIYFGDESGFVRQLDIGDNDDGAAINRYFVKVFAGNVPASGAYGYESRRKQFLNSETYIYPTESTLTMTPSYSIDVYDHEQVLAATYTALDSDDVSTWYGSKTKRKRVPLLGINGGTLALKWTHSAISENFIFYPSLLNFGWKQTNMIV